MRPRVVVLGAVGAIEVAPVRQVNAALEWLLIEEPLARFEQIKAGKLPADFIEQVHGCLRARSLRGMGSRVMLNIARVARSALTIDAAGNETAR